MKKLKKSGSYLSMENLDVDEESQKSDNEDDAINDKSKDKLQNTNANDLAGLKFDNESVILHPIYILGQAFHKVSAVGSSTALVGIRN